MGTRANEARPRARPGQPQDGPAHAECRHPLGFPRPRTEARAIKEPRRLLDPEGPRVLAHAALNVLSGESRAVDYGPPLTMERVVQKRAAGLGLAELAEPR